MDRTVKFDDVWSFILGIGIGILIGALITAINIGLTTKKFCPACGRTYADGVYCEHDATLLKERGN